MAARIISGAEIASRKTCRESVFSAGEAVTKGPRPAKAFDRDTSGNDQEAKTQAAWTQTDRGPQQERQRHQEQRRNVA